MARKRRVVFLSRGVDTLVHSMVILDYDILSQLVLDLDQTPHAYVYAGKHTFSLKGSKNVPIKVLDDKRQITTTFVVTAAGSFLPREVVYQGKSESCLPKFTFPSDFHVRFAANHQSNLENCEDFLHVIIFPNFSAKKSSVL